MACGGSRLRCWKSSLARSATRRRPRSRRRSRSGWAPCESALRGCARTSNQAQARCGSCSRLRRLPTFGRFARATAPERCSRSRNKSWLSWLSPNRFCASGALRFGLVAGGARRAPTPPRPPPHFSALLDLFFGCHGKLRQTGGAPTRGLASWCFLRRLPSRRAPTVARWRLGNWQHSADPGFSQTHRLGRDVHRRHRRSSPGRRCAAAQ
jgi:hypothetical protein